MAEEEKKESFFQKLKNFLQHDTVWRIVAVASAAVTVGLSGGAAIPVAILCLVFVTSFISVIGKAIQLRGLEKALLQRSLVKKIATTKQKTQSLVKTREHKRVLDLIKKQGPLNKTHQLKVPTPTYTKSFLKTLRNVGLENATSIISLALGGNIVGVAGYMLGAGLFIKNIKQEFNDRVKTDFKKAEAKKEINDICTEQNIPTYKNTEELHSHFKDEMVVHEATKRLLGTDTEKMSDQSIKDLYSKVESEIAEKIQFETLPPTESFIKQFRNTINPFNKDPIKTIDSIQEEFDKLAFYKEPTHAQKSGQSERVPNETPPTVNLEKDRSPIR